ncbi:MAG: VCBS repeat-containing protein [Acidobacteriota bacterium]
MSPRTRIWRLPVLSTVILLSAASGAAEEEAAATKVPPPDVGVQVRQLSGARLIEAVLPGRVLSLSLPESSDGGVIAALIAREDDPKGPRVVYVFDPTGDGSLDVLADDLPPEVNSIGRFARTPEQQIWILGQPGRIYSLGPTDNGAAQRRPTVLIDDPALDLGLLRRRGLLRSDQPFLPQPGLGRLEIFQGQNGHLQSTRSVDLPLRAERRGQGLRLSTPPVHLLASPETALPLVAVGPERQGHRRLRTTLIDPNTNGTDDGPPEAWSQLSANERIAQSWYFTVDGRPILAVAALNADKLGIFERKKLRVFPLRTDRTRAGVRPSLEILTATRNWYDISVDIADFDLDGRQDLLVGQPDGLGAKKLAVEVYRGKGNAGFFNTPRKSVVLARYAKWVFDQDLSGDRVPDLVTLVSDRLQIFTGIAQSKKKVLDKTPRWDLALVPDEDDDVSIHIHIDTDEDDATSDDTDSDTDQPNDLGRTGQPTVTDLDGDGRGEVLVRSSAGGRAILRVVELGR